MKKSELRELYKMMFPNYPDIITVCQLREMLGISRTLAYALINDGYIQAIKLGNTYKIPKVSVINYIMTEAENEKENETNEKQIENCGCGNLASDANEQDDVHRRGSYSSGSECA